jgi:hypothetical protein
MTGPRGVALRVAASTTPSTNRGTGKNGASPSNSNKGDGVAAAVGVEPRPRRSRAEDGPFRRLPPRPLLLLADGPRPRPGWTPPSPW